MSDDKKPDNPPIVHRITAAQNGRETSATPREEPPVTNQVLIDRVHSFTMPSMRRPNGTLANAMIEQKLAERENALVTKMRKTKSALRTRSAPIIETKKTNGGNDVWS